MGWEREGSREARREVTSAEQRGGDRGPGWQRWRWGDCSLSPLTAQPACSPETQDRQAQEVPNTHTLSHTLHTDRSYTHTHTFYIHRDFTPAFHTHIHVFYMHTDFIHIHTYAHILTFM